MGVVLTFLEEGNTTSLKGTARLFILQLNIFLVLDCLCIPCSTKILREFYFADWRVFVVCGNKFLRVEMTEMFAGNLFLRCSVQAAGHSRRNLNTFNFYCTVC